MCFKSEHHTAFRRLEEEVLGEAENDLNNDCWYYVWWAHVQCRLCSFCSEIRPHNIELWMQKCSQNNDISVHKLYPLILAQQRYTQHIIMLHSTFSNKLAHLHVELLVWPPCERKGPGKWHLGTKLLYYLTVTWNSDECGCTSTQKLYLSLGDQAS